MRSDHEKIQADQETLLATKLAPDKPEVWRARAKIFEALKRPAEANAAAKKAAPIH